MPLRISGLASGIDVDSIVKDLMKAHRIPLDKLKQQQQLVTWQREAYLALNSKIYDYRNNKLFKFTLEGTLSARKATVSGESGVLTAKATGTAPTTTMQIKVAYVATAASNYSSGDIRLDPTFDPNASLASQVSAGKIAAFSTNSLTINGKTVTFDPNTDSLNSVIAKINRETNVSAFYDPGSGRISFVAKNTGLVNGASGTGDKIEFGTEDFVVNVLKVSTNSAQAVAAQNAKIYVNGMEIVRTSNTFTINGVELQLLKPSSGNPLDPNTLTPTTVQVSLDVDSIVESIKQFVSDYNDMLKAIQDKLGEQRYRDYLPLTDEQKKEMTEEQIKLWEEKAKSGLLRNDQYLAQAERAMRSAIQAVVDTGSTTYKTLSSIGITTGLYQEKGKLYLDETKLRKALEEDPNAVVALFSQNGTGSAQGIADRIYAALGNTLNQIKGVAGANPTIFDQSVLGKKAKELDARADSLEEKLKELEDHYYRQFSIMEQAISRYNAQSAYLMNLFGGRNS